ncbi:MAG TPA: TIGR02281 family clan AA aspartic protease [Candidatus Binatia bacterium]
MRATTQHLPRLALRLTVLVGLLCAAGPALATDVRVVAITPGRSADLLIDGRGPLTVDIGSTIEGVTVLRADYNGALVRVDGTTRTLALTSDSSAGHVAAGSTLTLPADARGQFWVKGSINERPVSFIVDTGATFVVLSRSDAARLGVDYSHGKAGRAMTANGPVRGWLIVLPTLRVGDVTVHDVEAAVNDSEMPFALLGMSFLNRFEMQRQGTTLVLRRSR